MRQICKDLRGIEDTKRSWTLSFVIGPADDA
jgi:hypothetical protein